MLCSCYVPSTSFSSRSSSSEDSNRSSNNINKKRLYTEKRGDDGVMEELTNNNNNGAQKQDKSINGCSNLKSNLKKTKMVELEAENQVMRSTVERKKVVTWSDAHAKDIAHVQEFEPSTASEDGELEGVHNSCVCTIQ